MQRLFNTAGPCKPDIHYMLPPLARLPDMDRLIQQSDYFSVHAPRQTGKTTAMLALANQLLASGHYVVLTVSAETGHRSRMILVKPNSHPRGLATGCPGSVAGPPSAPGLANCTGRGSNCQRIAGLVSLALPLATGAAD